MSSIFFVGLIFCSQGFLKLQDPNWEINPSQFEHNMSITTIVKDNATKELMVQFHTRLRDGERPAVALNEAQKYLIKNTKYSSPVFWSPFILIGDSE